MATQSINLTSAQCIIPLARLQKQKGFTQADLEIHNEICNPATEPLMFDNSIIKQTYGLEFKGRRLVSMSELDTNDIYGDSVRASINSEYDNINDSIQNEGFKLNQLMPCAYRKNKKWIILEGRTRISILKAIGVSDKLLINEYEKVNDKIPDSAFGLHSNTVYAPKGVASQADMVRTLENLLSNGYFEFDASINQDEAKRDFKKEVKAYVKDKFPKMKLSGPNLEALMNTAMASKSLKHNIKAFSSLEHAMSHLNNVLGVCDTKKYKYIMATTDEWGIFKRIIPAWQNLRAMGDNRIIRVVTCKLAPESAIDWHLANLRVGRKMQAHINSLMEIHNTSSNGVPQIEIYGTIPQCESLSTKYPMDKIVQYSRVTDAEYNLHGEKV